jgi:decaprenylphospho-beta-D-ribofuranose 2-oxidase
MGRSYGDAAQRAGGYVLDMTALKGFELDEPGAAVTASAGVSLGELLAELVPSGWMLPVVPGTQHVTVGGAIASDIHGKNHGHDGTLGRHVQAIGLLTAAGELLEVGPDRGRDLFAATLGGMGLTGIIVWARIGLERIHSALMTVDSDRVPDLDAAMSLLSAPGGRRYRVAWLDLLGPRPGRGIVTRAEHIDVTENGCCGRAPSAPTTSSGSVARRAASETSPSVSALICSRSTCSTDGRGSTARGASSSTSSWSRPGPST